jgi:hypothetical protein
MTIKYWDDSENPDFKPWFQDNVIFLTTSKILAKDLTLVFICKFLTLVFICKF